jgi:hypothetical protein
MTDAATESWQSHISKRLGRAVAKGKDSSKESGAVKQAMTPAYWAMDYYFDNLRKAVSSIPSGGTEFGEKLKRYAEENIAATHDLIKRLTEAKDFDAVVRIQNEFIRSQLKILGKQSESLGETYTKTGVDLREK